MQSAHSSKERLKNMPVAKGLPERPQRKYYVISIEGEKYGMQLENYVKQLESYVDDLENWIDIRAFQDGDDEIKPEICGALSPDTKTPCTEKKGHPGNHKTKSLVWAGPTGIIFGENEDRKLKGKEQDARYPQV
jgi:hypothetical protein